MHQEEDSNFDMLTILLQDGKQGMETRWSIQACEEPNESLQIFMKLLANLRSSIPTSLHQA